MHYRNSDHYKRADSRKLRPHNGTPALPSLKLLRLMNRLSNRKTVRQLLFSVSFYEKKTDATQFNLPRHHLHYAQISIPIPIDRR